MLLRLGLLSLLVASPACERTPPDAPPSAPAVASVVPSTAPSTIAILGPTPEPEAGAPDAASATVQLTGSPIALPGATGPAFLDYIACDRARSRLWVPVGSTGSVDVLDIASGAFTRVDGFKTAEREMYGKKRTMGPSAASVGDGVVYIGNRATSEVCPIDVTTLRTGTCLKLPSATDGVVYVPSAKEVWVTTPRDQSLTVLDASKAAALAPKTTVKTDGSPEGYAVDDARGVFFTNLEDKGGTVAIDIKTHKVKSTWSPGCGRDGPRGLAFDSARNHVIVACTDHVQVLDAGRDGALLGRLDTGAGVDNIDYVDGKLYVAAAKAARLTIAALDDRGQLTVVATGSTSEGARNAVADEKGNVFVADSMGARVIVFRP